MKKILLTTLFAFLFFVSCATVRPYEKVYINDDEMKLAPLKGESSEMDFHNYREGSVGANGTGTDGGCGCN